MIIYAFTERARGIMGKHLSISADAQHQGPKTKVQGMLAWILILTGLIQAPAHADENLACSWSAMRLVAVAGLGSLLR